MFSALQTSLVSSIQRFINAQEDLAIQLDITNACNLRCAHCYHAHHDNDGALNFSGWMQIIDQYERLLEKLRLKPRIILCGGEPLTSSLLRPIIEDLNQRFPSVPITLLSNGTLVRPALAQYLAKFNIGVQVSLDGPDAERHDQIRGPGSFQRAINGIKILKAAGIRVTSLAVLSSKTAPWLEDFFATAKREDLHSMNFTRFIPQGSGARLADSGNDRMLTATELKATFQSIVNLSKSTGMKSNSTNPLFQLINGAEGGNGKFGHQGLVVDYRGRLKVSSRTDFILGDVRIDGLEALFLKHPIMEALRRGNIATCGKCPHYSRCGGDRNVAYATTGSFLGPDPQCWLFPKT